MQALAYDMWRGLLAAGAGGVAFGALCAATRLVRQAMQPAKPPPAPLPAPDELEGVEGIGPKIGELFRNAGIHTFADLAARTPDQLRAILDEAGVAYRPSEPASWPFQARLLAEGRISDFLALAVALRGGAPRLEDIVGIGEGLGQTLRAVDIHSPETLSELNSDQLQARLGKRAVVSREDAVSWIAQARALHNGDVETYMRLGGLPTLPPRLPQAPAAKAPEAGRGTPAAGPAVDPSILNCLACTALPAALLMVVVYFLEHEPPDNGPTIPTPAVCPGKEVCMLPPEHKQFLTSNIFDFREARITAEGRKVIEAFVGQVKAGAKGQSPTAVIVVGHADRFGQPQGPKGNDALSRDRAVAVERELQREFGWPREIVHAYGRGEDVPNPAHNTLKDCREATGEASEADQFCHRWDRRVEVTVFYLPPETGQGAGRSGGAPSR